MSNFFHTVSSRSDLIIEAFLQHIFLSFVALALGVAIALPTGILIARYRRFAEPIIGVTAVLQTIPSLALFGILVPLIGIGSKTALIALIIYALLPIVRNTYTGLTSADESIIEAGRGMGMTPFQILKKIEFPIALPVIMAGIRTATVLTVGIATLATFVGAGGLGDVIYRGLQSYNNSLVLAGALPVACLAILFDFLLKWIEKKVTLKGIRQ
ncbi:ABC transporter permease [Sporosarcina pasteurii]|uniref:Osmoprotectant uptake system permease protein yehW n=1 Tax=Sporosarcina pasteurii TaxID=1474 RepID=A0A380CJ72_SPOPA|nr:ABC transporter permease [Sporosarcina pasteurii]MDS9472121.1 ABC transporter permease [Sporosarcina pasteurii]QBQ06836.1 ABC transporter permease [Sporosarcina pasteurii]SUJ20572.1 Putative osmoprotectant uptake system permease protein yehW [Sporosarcina pasteurii]